MWIARDKIGLRLFTNKPVFLDKFNFFSGDKTSHGILDGFVIDSNLFPKLRIKDEPIEVELVSKKFMDDWRAKNAVENRLLELTNNIEEVPESIQGVVNDHFDEMI